MEGGPRTPVRKSATRIEAISKTWCEGGATGNEDGGRNGMTTHGRLDGQGAGRAAVWSRYRPIVRIEVSIESTLSRSMAVPIDRPLYRNDPVPSLEIGLTFK